MRNELPVRKNIRLSQYDYSATGYYFITICVNVGAATCRPNTDPNVGAAICRPNTDPTVGAAICRPNIELTDIGKIIDSAIKNISGKYLNVSVDKYVIMPNHVHLILIIQDAGRQIAAPTVQTVIGHMKRAVSMQCGFSPWQKSFHDRIIRSEAEYQQIWQYIDENPARWAEDDYYTETIAH